MFIVLTYKHKLDTHLIRGGVSMKLLILIYNQWLHPKAKSLDYTERIEAKKEKEMFYHMEIVKHTTIDSIRTRT